MILILKRSMKSELKRIQRLIDLAGDIDQETVGFVEKKSRGKHNYFYLCTKKNGKRKRVYLGKENSYEVKKAMAVMYRRKKREILEHNMGALKDALDDLWDDSVAGIYAALSRNCKEACREGFLDKRLEELKAWAAEDYPRNTWDYPEAENFAMDGTRVRSKGEEIWYNMLLAAGIPFRYDCVITVTAEDGCEYELSPDFMIQCYDGTMIIIEHLGGLKNEKYRHDIATKIYYYQKEGYVVGDNLFLTSDDAKFGTNSEMILRKLQEIELMFYRGA